MELRAGPGGRFLAQSLEFRSKTVPSAAENYAPCRNSAQQAPELCRVSSWRGIPREQAPKTRRHELGTSAPHRPLWLSRTPTPPPKKKQPAFSLWRGCPGSPVQASSESPQPSQLQVAQGTMEFLWK